MRLGWLLVAVLAAGGAVDVPPLRQHYRPPRQTAEQREAVQKVADKAPGLSAAAKGWVLEYMGSQAVRERLHPSLQHYSNDELLEMFSWEFEHLPLIHNAPIDALDDSQAYAHDDTALELTLENGYLQNVCQRYVFGGPESKAAVDSYAKFFSARMGIPPQGQHWTTRNTSQCLLYLANNLPKTSDGNSLVYGGATYVLNPATMKGRVLVEAWDGGLMESMYKELTPPVYPPLGTPTDYYQLVKPHEEFFNLPYPPSWHMPPSTPCCNYSLADLFNRWWVKGTPVPITGMLVSNPYYEVMAMGNVWLPEDVLYMVVQFGNRTTYPPTRSVGLWGTPLGSLVREHMRKAHRPLIWSNTRNSAMLIDPTVGGIAGKRIEQSDVELFDRFWSKTPSYLVFEELSLLAPKHLHFILPSYPLRDACKAESANNTNMVMGTDGEGNCVYWTEHPPASTRWERLNDGTCEASVSPRATYDSKEACEAPTPWDCVESGKQGARYCVPSATGGFSSIDECEKTCQC